MTQRTPEERKCNQCGVCCQDVQLQISPQEMERIRKNEGESQFHNDQGRQCAEMLEYRGEWEVVACGMVRPTYHYSCKNLKPLPDGKFECGIYETRPTMCRTFPFCGVAKFPMELNDEQKLKLLALAPYISQYKGCTLNIDDQDPAMKEPADYYSQTEITPEVQALTKPELLCEEVTT